MKQQTTIYKTSHRKTKDLEGPAVPAPYVTPVMLLLNVTNIIQYTSMNTNGRIKHEPPISQMGAKTARTSFVRGNRNVHHTTEAQTRRQVI
jgi:hypothetical protein